MARDIEEFLRRAAERRAQQKSQAADPAKPESRQPASTPPPRTKPRPVRPPVEVVEVELVEPTLVAKSTRQPMSDSPITRQKLQSEMRDESVSEHVARHLDTSRISEHSKSLGQRITSVHDQVDSDIHRRLDHDISVIDDTPTITDDERTKVVGADTSAMAGELLNLLSQPKTIRQAILINEILTRPNFDDD